MGAGQLANVAVTVCDAATMTLHRLPSADVQPVALAATLANAADVDVLLRKFDGINQRSENQRREQIFSKLDLRLSAAEEKALRFRNPATHGHKNPSDWVPIIKYGPIMQCLIVRVLLRLLGYDGQYVDYATPGWPSRHIAEPCGQTN